MGSNGCLWKLRMNNGIIITAICLYRPCVMHSLLNVKHVQQIANIQNIEFDCLHCFSPIFASQTEKSFIFCSPNRKIVPGPMLSFYLYRRVLYMMHSLMEAKTYCYCDVYSHPPLLLVPDKILNSSADDVFESSATPPVSGISQIPTVLPHAAKTQPWYKPQIHSVKKVKLRLKVWHLYTAAYRETRTTAVYNSKLRTDWQWHKWRSASSGHPLPEWMDFGPHSLQLDRPINAPASRTMAFTTQCSPATTHYF